MRRCLTLMMTTVAAVLCFQVSAGTLPEPKGPVILTISGDIANTNANGEARFDRQMLEGLGMHLTATQTPWTDGVTRFEGPLGRTLLEAVGATGTEAQVTALNDYSAKVPVVDFYNDDVIFALKSNSEYMRVREKGPLFIIYPFDDNEKLKTEVIYNRSVWQIKSIKIK